MLKSRVVRAAAVRSPGSKYESDARSEKVI